MRPWRVKMPTQNLLRLLLLLILVMRIVLATVYCRFRLWALMSRFWSWSSAEILKLKFGQYFADVLKRLWNWILVKFYEKADVWLGFWSWCLVEILKMKLDQDLCLNLWYELDPRVRCAFGRVILYKSYKFFIAIITDKIPPWWDFVLVVTIIILIIIGLRWCDVSVE